MARLTDNEREFLSDIKRALKRFDYKVDDVYHEDGGLVVEIGIEEEDWGYRADEIWNALEEVRSDWGAGLDSDSNNYYMYLS